MVSPRPTLDAEFGGAFDGRRILVTGATGFLGRHLCDALVTLGADVHALSRSIDAASCPAGCTPWQVDLEDQGATTGAMTSLRPGIVYHLASMVDGTQSKDLVLPMLRANLLGTVHLALAAIEVGCPHFVAVGSSEEPRDDVSEVPSSPYAAAKASATQYLRMLHQTFGLPAVMVRPFLSYGPGQSRSKLIPFALSKLLRGEAPLISSGERRCDFIHVSDVVRGLCYAGVTTGQFGKHFDLGTGISTSIRDVITLMADLAGSTVSPVFGSTQDRVGERETTAAVALTRDGLGWEPHWNLRDGLTDTIRVFRMEEGI